MPTALPPHQPDVSLGIHPEHGIVATTPTQRPAASWMLERLDFHPVPGHPTLFMLKNQARDGHTRAAQAIATLRMVGYEVNANVILDPDLTSPHPVTSAHTTPPRPAVGPDVAFAEHPWLGVIAATSDTANATDHAKPILEANGWQHDQEADVYILPPGVDRRTVLDRVAQAVTTMQHTNDLQVALQPALAHTVAARATSMTHAYAQVNDFPTRKFAVGDAARTTSPALAAQPPTPAALPAAPAAAPPANPRIGFAHSR